MVTVPALGFTAADIGSLEAQGYWWEKDMYIPSHYQIDSTMTIVQADSGSTDPSGYLSK
jgi:hypothetical protein